MVNEQTLCIEAQTKYKLSLIPTKEINKSKLVNESAMRDSCCLLCVRQVHRLTSEIISQNCVKHNFYAIHLTTHKLILLQKYYKYIISDCINKDIKKLSQLFFIT